MNRVLPIFSLCVALLALAFALVPRDPVVVGPPAETGARGVDLDAELLRRRVEVLEDENRALWDRVVVLERTKNAVVSFDGGAVSPAVVSEVAALRQELRGVMTGEVLSSDASRAALKEVIREAEADAQRERFAQRQQRQEQRVEEQKAKWKDFISTAKLTSSQEQELTKRLDAEEASRKALAAQRQTGEAPDFDAFRAMRDQRRETDQSMSKLLDDTQKQQYQSMRREDRGQIGGERGGEPGRNEPGAPR